MSLRRSLARSADALAKRALDIAGAGAGLCLLGLPMAVIGVLVRLDSPGPALFKQERCGRHNRRFLVLKFRTMHTSEGAKVTVGNDTRITRLGGFLRRTKLDELPQLLNILKGDMSLVGPRPEVPDYVALYAPELRDVVLGVRPGITDPVSLVLIDESELLAKAKDPAAYYRDVLLLWKVSRQAEYVRTRTFCGDLGVILRTIWKVVHRGEEAAIPPPPEA